MKRFAMAFLLLGGLCALGYLLLAPRDPVAPAPGGGGGLGPSRAEAPVIPPAPPTEAEASEAPAQAPQGREAPRSPKKAVPTQGLPVREEAPALTGLEVEAVGASDKARLGIPDDYGSGVMITQVHPDAPAAEAGLREGDVIVRAMRSKVSSPQDLEQAVGTRGHALLIAVRDGQLMQLVLQRPFEAEPEGSN